jgi:hypothetical protein
MKLSLAELKVDSYATQVSETELTAVKGGSSIPCAAGVYTLGAAIFTGLVAVTNNLIQAANDHKECGETRITRVDECGNSTVITIHNCNE